MTSGLFLFTAYFAVLASAQSGLLLRLPVYSPSARGDKSRAP